MAKPPLNPDVIGKYRRSLDIVSEEKDAEESEKVADVLQWLKEEVPQHQVQAQSKNRLKDLIDAGLQLDVDNKVTAIDTLKNSPHKGMILSRLVDVSKDIYYAGKDLVSSNRVKTSLTILGSIGAGVAIGAVLGSIVLPGIGTAIGGTIGATLTAALTALGGSVGLGILGGFLGSWFGKKISDKAYKREKRFEISKRITKKIRKQIGISSPVTQMINGYLYNRAKTISSPLCKKYYKLLRRLAILEADPTAMEKVARFFCQELLLLEREMQNEKSSKALELDQKAVVYILKKLKASTGLSQETKDKITTTFAVYKQKHKALPSLSMHQGLEYQPTQEISPDVLRKADSQFIARLPQLGVSTVDSVNKKSSKGTISYRYHFITKEGEALPEMVFKRKSTSEHYLTSVTIKANLLTNKNKDQVTKMIVAQAKAYQESTGNNEVIVMAAGDHDLALRLMVAVHQAGMKPTLDQVEYPEDSAQRKEILNKVKTLTQREAPGVQFRKKPGL